MLLLNLKMSKTINLTDLGARLQTAQAIETDMLRTEQYFHFGNVNQRIIRASQKRRVLEFLIEHPGEMYSRSEMKTALDLSSPVGSEQAYHVLVFVRQSKILEPQYTCTAEGEERYGVRLWETKEHALFPAGKWVKPYQLLGVRSTGKNYGGMGGITLFGSYFKSGNRELEYETISGRMLRLFLEFPGVGFTRDELEKITSIKKHSQCFDHLAPFVNTSSQYLAVSERSGHLTRYGITHRIKPKDRPALLVYES